MLFCSWSLLLFATTCHYWSESITHFPLISRTTNVRSTFWITKVWTLILLCRQQGNRKDFSERAHTVFRYWLSMPSIAKLQIKSTLTWSIFPLECMTFFNPLFYYLALASVCPPTKGDDIPHPCQKRFVEGRLEAGRAYRWHYGSSLSDLAGRV